MRKLRMSVVLFAVLAALATVPAAASAAFAAPVRAAATVSVPDEQTATGTSYELTTGSSAVTTDATGARCETSWARKTEYNVFHLTLFWFQLNTYWCWNGSIVTYHNTYVTWDITTLGGDVGWLYDGTGGIAFHCYVASGSTRNCSGNYEAATAHFQLCVIKYGCIQNVYFFIEEWENYRGQFFTNV